MTELFVGVDTGGTFTDFVLLQDGKIRIHKVLSTPGDPARAILQGLTDLGVSGNLDALVHGSTVATNAVLERKGVRTGLITTAGFRDVLEIGRQTRPKLYALNVQKEPPLVPRPLRVEVVERLDELGEVLIPLDDISLKAALEHLQAANVEAVAVCLLFSFANPDHERSVAGAAGFKQAITLDIGGTSTDVALVDGTIAQTTDGKIGGHPVKLPMIDINTVGAGGGSIAWFDTGGALRVGPGSAGADPGPAAYGRGGTEPTVTDANVVLGRLLPQAFLGGTMSLDSARAREAVLGIAERLGTSPEEAALGIVRVVNANMEAAIRVSLCERGYDPRSFILVAFGGAGPLHACELAAALQIPQVLIPGSPGVLSALGMLAADIIKDYVRTVMVPSEAAQARVDAVFSELEQQGRADLAREGFSSEQVAVERLLDLRYLGQSYEIVVPYTDKVTQAVASFHTAHERRFGYHNPLEHVQVVSVRLKAHSRPTRPVLAQRAGEKQAIVTPAAVQPVIFTTNGTIAQDTAVYKREALLPGMTFKGPAIVTQYDTTTVLPPGWLAEIDAFGHIIARYTGKEEQAGE